MPGRNPAIKAFNQMPDTAPPSKRDRDSPKAPKRRQQIVESGSNPSNDSRARVRLRPHKDQWNKILDCYRQNSLATAQEICRLSLEAEDERVRSVCGGMVMERAWGKPREFDAALEKDGDQLDLMKLTPEQRQQLRELIELAKVKRAIATIDAKPVEPPKPD